ncbi:MAG: tetratricopeptide repeat protein [Verrucomicrobia bacterium]|nr:tetratricopeptide repeat protein [Verrucomicrobiota bacterium]
MRRCLLRIVACVMLAPLLMGCFPRCKPLDPCFCYVPQKGDFRGLPSVFPPLSAAEKQQEWGREYSIGVQFANDLDLYRAITSFKRSLYLLPRGKDEREKELYTFIATCYYLGERYEEVIATVVESPLIYLEATFPAYVDLLTMLYVAYVETGKGEQAQNIARQLEAVDQKAAQTAELATVLTHGQVGALPRFAGEPGITDLLNNYCLCKKSVMKAQALSALVPGAGFLYVGQKQTALTSFLINVAFIIASWQFFDRGYWAAGAFMTSLELGWYTGAIYGSGEAAHKFNERLYEYLAEPILRHRRLHPPLMVRWRF